MEAHGQSLGSIPYPAGCVGRRCSTTLRTASAHRCTVTLARLRVWLIFASHRALMAHSTAAHAAVSFASRFIFDVYCSCCMTFFHTRQRVHEHLVDGKRSFFHTLAASVEPASDDLVQQLLDQDKRIRRASKKLSLEWQPKHLPAIRMHGPLQPWAHRLGRWASA